MTIRLLNALTEFFKLNPNKEICLRDYGDDGYYTIMSWSIDDDISNIDSYIKKYPSAELSTFDGDFYEEFEY